MAEKKPKKRIATVWLCGCSGCHMSFLDLDEKLFDLNEVADVVATPVADVKEFPQCDIALVEGAVANEENLAVLQEVRRRAAIVVSLGDCAGFGCVPMLRNQFTPEEVLDHAYIEVDSTAMGEVPREEVPKLTQHVRPIHEHVKVDAWIPGCPPSADAIWSAVKGLLSEKAPAAAIPLRYD